VTELLLRGKRCLVTGGTRGLGRAIVRAFARHGAKVAFTYAHRDADAEETSAELGALGAEHLVLKGSTADAAHAKDAIERVVKAWQGIDVLVNNAAIMQVLPISLLEESDWDLVMDVNVKGPYLFTRAALRSMIRQRSGHVLFIGSFVSERVVESPVHFAASKSALRGLTESLAREVGRYGIQVNLVAPGLLDVGLAQTLPQHRQKEYVERSALRRLGRAEDVAESIAFLVSGENRFMSGAKIGLDGGIEVPSPRSAFVTGGSGAIGREVVRRFVERGLVVHFSFATNELVASELARDTGAIPHRVEFRDRTALPRLLAELPDITVFVHAAGRLGPLSFDEVTPAEQDALTAVNLDAALLGTRALLPRMRKEGGAIVFVGALDRTQSLPIPAAFAATQGALATATMALAHELGRDAIRVNLVASGLLDQGLGTRVGAELVRDYLAYSALRRLGTPLEVSRMIAWLALDDRVMTGRVVSVNGGI